MHVVQVSWLRGAAVHTDMGYAGIERVARTLSLELVRQGHKVTLIAPPGSALDGVEVIETNDFDEAARIIPSLKADVVHSHEVWAIESVMRRGLSVPMLASTHVTEPIGYHKNVVYLSEAQKKYHKGAAEAPIVRVPTDPTLHPKGLPKQDYLLFLGMGAPWKGVHRAARVACLLDRKLIVAGPCSGDYRAELEHFKCIEFVGEVRDPYRSELIEQAYAMMCLHGNENGWYEPGAGVIGEAGAFNVPVAATPNGCLEEIVLDGENGWNGRTVEEVAFKMIDQPTLLDPGRLARTEWSAENVTKQYLALYEKVIGGATWQ